MHYDVQGEQFDRFIDVIKVLLAGL